MRLITIYTIIITLLVQSVALAQEAFQPKASLISNVSQQSVVLTADFNGDTVEDLLVFQFRANEEACCRGNYRILVNNGSGNFSQEIEVATDVEEWDDIRISDVDGDNLSDIVAYSAVDNTINVYQNENSSSFSEPLTLTNNYPSSTLRFADFTGDGLADIIYSLSDTDDQLFLSIGEGAFNYSSLGAVATGALVHIADFDEDGNNDFFTTEPTDGTITWHPGNGDGTFVAKPTNITNEISPSIPDIVVGDLGGDNTNELVISYATAGEEGIVAPKLYSFSENEEFVLEGSLIELEEFDFSPQNVQLNDIDQDGDLDILASFTFALAFARTESDFDQYVGWYENTGNYEFNIRLLDDALLTGTYVDLNNDQQLDILLNTPNELLGQKNQGQGIFSEPEYLTDSRNIPTTSSDESGTFINFGDLNQDGFPEMLVTEGRSNRVLSFSNQDSILVVPPNLLALNTLIPGDAAILETPERVDLLLMGGDAREGRSIFRYTVQEESTLGTKDTLYNGTLDAAYFTGDFTGDGQPDVAFTDRSFSVDGEVLMLTGQPNGTYELVETQIIGTLSEAYDVNQDRIMDMVVEGNIYTQSSEGSFDILLTPDFPFNHIEDINGDSLADFLLLSEAEVTLFLANNDGTYQEQTLTFDESYDFTSIPWLFMDIDNDSDQDIVLVNNTGDERELAYLLNLNGTTVFGEYTVIERLPNVNALLFKYDIDQDTDTDLVVLTDTELAWYRNNAIQNEAADLTENVPPTVVQPIDDQQLTVDSAFSLVISTDVFRDANREDTLTLAATLADDTPLPGWLTFDAATNTLSGTPPEAGELTIKVTASDTAAASVSDEFILTVNANTITSLDTEESLEGIRLYPVPASQQLFLENKNPSERFVAYRLLNTQGKTIQDQSLSNQRRTQIDVSFLPVGLYLLEIQTANQVLQRRLLIE